MKHILLRFSLLAACFCMFIPTTSDAQFYYGLQQRFGKNRVQYQEFQWSYYRLKGYDVYYYRQSREVAQYVAEMARLQIKAFEKFLDYPLDDRLEFLVYNKLSDLRQSNIELATSEEYNTGGMSRIVGSRVFLYFDGDYRSLDQQIRAGIIQVIVDQMMYGGNIRDVIRSSTFINLPDWYLLGLVSYLSDPDNVDIQNRIMDGVRSERFYKFKILTEEESIAAGHAIWQYIGYTYGKSVISQILYMTRINNNIESGFNFILGTDLNNLNDAWLSFYKDKLVNSESSMPEGDVVKLKTNKQSKVSQFKLNPDRDMLAYVSNELGQYKVYLQTIAERQITRIYKGGHAIDPKGDWSYPLLAWHPNGRVLAMIVEEQGNVQIKVRDIDEEEWVLERPIFHIDKIISITYSNDGKKLLISGMKNGQSDIFEYNILSNTFDQLTKDIYDDFDPVYLKGGEFIAFASTRPDDTLRGADGDSLTPMENTDLYILNRSKPDNLWRITNSPETNETKLDGYGNASFVYLAAKDGIRERNIVEVDSAIAYVDTTTHYRYVSRRLKQSDYSVSIIEHDVDSQLGNLAELFYFDGAYQLRLNKINNIDALSEIAPEVVPEEKPVPVEIKPIPADSIIEVEPIIFDTLSVETDSLIEELPKIETFEDDMPSGDTLIFKREDKYKGKKEFDLDNYEFHPDLINERNRKKEERKQVKVDPDKPQEKLFSSDVEVIEEGKEADASSETNDSSEEAKLEEPKKDDEQFELPSPKNYIRAFFTNYFVSQLDNSFLDESYQPFTGGGPLYLNPSFNGLIKIGVGDLFEDYKLVGAIRLATSLDNAEYYFSLRNLKHRIDHVYNFNRKSLTSAVNETTLQKVLIHSFEYEGSYPFSEVAALKASLGVRYDHGVILATDARTLNEPDNFTTWLQFGTQYVFDNTLPKGINLYNGLRYKAFYEYYQNIESFDQGMHVIGVDFRHYQKIHRTFIWANRFAASTSFGQQKLIYFMGGVDSWFTPVYNVETPISQKHNYSFQTLATNMRGFIQNARNGNSFFVYNSELRMPLFTYLLNRPLKSDFVKNFQIVTFFDLGTAWTGATPYSKDNALNNTVVKNGAITVQLDRQREPIIYGYGFGLRSKLLGYFVRLDWAWGVEDQITLPRVFYLSLSQDF